MSKAVLVVATILSLCLFSFIIFAGLGHLLNSPPLPSSNLEAWTQLLSMIAGGLVSFISVTGLSRDEPKDKKEEPKDGSDQK